MKLTYDARYNIAYMQFQKRKTSVQTIPISVDLNLDLSPKGTLYGIELLNARKQLKIKRAKD
ncbi:MAG TPA: DUF2283 domain-containing protein [Candidatus Omnitrophota bacterium]|nr:DUF2283 domain-containing protein [Candidatus Omnitrophota bacterium]